MLSCDIPEKLACGGDPTSFRNHLLCDCYWNTHHCRPNLSLFERFQTHLLPGLSSKTWVSDHGFIFFIQCRFHIVYFCPSLEVLHQCDVCWSIQHIKVWKHLLDCYQRFQIHHVPLQGCEVHWRFTLNFEGFNWNGHCLGLNLKIRTA